MIASTVYAKTGAPGISADMRDVIIRNALLRLDLDRKTALASNMSE